jgi:hypothetical protein
LIVIPLTLLQKTLYLITFTDIVELDCYICVKKKLGMIPVSNDVLSDFSQWLTMRFNTNSLIDWNVSASLFFYVNEMIKTNNNNFLIFVERRDSVSPFLMLAVSSGFNFYLWVFLLFAFIKCFATPIIENKIIELKTCLTVIM